MTRKGDLVPFGHLSFVQLGVENAEIVLNGVVVVANSIERRQVL
jgi:hypothetical protein